MKIREGIDRFSIVYPYWTNLTYSEDPGVWDRDLKEQINFNSKKIDKMTVSELLNRINEILKIICSEINI